MSESLEGRSLHKLSQITSTVLSQSRAEKEADDKEKGNYPRHVAAGLPWAKISLHAQFSISPSQIIGKDKWNCLEESPGNRARIIKMQFPAHSLYLCLGQPTWQALESQATVTAWEFLEGILCVCRGGGSETFPNSGGDQLWSLNLLHIYNKP